MRSLAGDPRHRVDGVAEQIAVVEPRAPAKNPHLLPELGLDERVDDDRRPPLGPLDGEPQVVDRLDTRVADLLELLVGELSLERVHEPRRRLAGGVGDDVELDRSLRHLPGG